MIEIRNFTASDHEFNELARIDNLVNHDSISHPDEDKHDWNIRDKSIIRDRIMLYNHNKLVGVVYYSQGRVPNERICFYTLNLDPNFNNKGYRTLLFNKLLEKIKVFNANKLFTGIYDHPNYHNHKNFLVNNGFKLTQTNREYSCDIKNINIDKYKSLIQTLESEGIQFYDSKEEMLNFPNHYKKLEELNWTYTKDFPIPDGIEHTRLPFKRFMEIQKDFEKNYYGVEIVAVRDDKYIGSTSLEVFPKSEPHKAYTEGLGVLKEYRRKGIATALKIKAIQSLLQKGIKEIRTDNEENNPMYKINVALGFSPVPSSLEYTKEIQ